MIKLWKYKHYKWKYYEVLWVSIHTETDEKLVLYKALYDISDLEKEVKEKNITFVRPYSMFFEIVSYNSKKIPRFEFVSE